MILVLRRTSRTKDEHRPTIFSDNQKSARDRSRASRMKISLPPHHAADSRTRSLLPVGFPTHHEGLVIWDAPCRRPTALYKPRDLKLNAVAVARGAMTTMPMKLTCACCATAFETPVLASTNYVGTYTDFRRRAVGFEPSQFAVHSCPGCGFSGPEGWFERKLSEAVRELVRENLSPLSRDARTSLWRKFEHAARIASWTAEPLDAVAELHLSAAYVCAANGRTEEERVHRIQAIVFFRRSIDTGVIAARHLPNVTYLVGELYRRIGLTDDANIWLERAEVLARKIGILPGSPNSQDSSAPALEI